MRPAVLIVEDDLTIQMLYENYLQGSRYRAISVASVNEARKVLKMLTPAAIVLDISLSGEDAWHFLAELKSPSATPCIPVIVATETDDVRKGFALGTDAYFIKPLEREDLLSAIGGLDPMAAPHSTAAASAQTAARHPEVRTRD